MQWMYSFVHGRRMMSRNARDRLTGEIKVVRSFKRKTTSTLYIPSKVLNRN